MAPKIYEFYFTNDELKYICFHKKICPCCGSKMHKISENKFDRKANYSEIMINGKLKYTYGTIGSSGSTVCNTVNEVPDIYIKKYYYNCAVCNVKYTLSELTENLYGKKEVKNDVNKKPSLLESKHGWLKVFCIVNAICGVLSIVCKILFN